MNEDILVIHRVENGWLLTVGDSSPGKPPGRRMVTTNPAHLGALAESWAYRNPPPVSERPAPTTPPTDVLELDPLRFGVEGKSA